MSTNSGSCSSLVFWQVDTQKCYLAKTNSRGVSSPWSVKNIYIYWFNPLYLTTCDLLNVATMSSRGMIFNSVSINKRGITKAWTRYRERGNGMFFNTVQKLYKLFQVEFTATCCRHSRKKEKSMCITL